MDRSLAALQHALSTYGLNEHELVIETILPKNYHGDDHFKIKIGAKTYSARFISDNRYEHDVFLPLTEAVLTEQMRFASFLNQNEVPLCVVFPRLKDLIFSN